MRSSYSFLRSLITCSLVAFASALFGQALQLNFSGVNPTCFSYTNGIATVAASGGSGTYYYHWENGQGGSSNLGVPAGTYSVTVTDAISGVTATGSTTLTHPPQLNLTIDPINANCGGFNGNLTTTVTGGTGAYHYAWSNGASSAIQSGLGSGGYFLTVTDDNGCSDVDFVHIYPAPNLFANFLITRPLCAGQTNGSITNVSIFGNNPPFTYQWPNGQANQSLTAVTGGTYNLIMSDVNGCTQTQPITIQDQTPLTLVMDKEDSKCAMTCDGVAKVFVSGGVAPYNILWSNGSTNSVVYPLPPGQYSVTVTDANNCTATGSVDITEPTPIIVNLVSVSGACSSTTGSITIDATGGVAPYSYQWNYNNTTGPSLSGVPSGTYYVIVTDANGCQKSLPFTIPGNGTLNVTLQTSSALCVGQSNGSANAIATGGVAPYSYSWNVQSVNAPSISGLAGSQTVTVTVTDANGCDGVASAYITVHQAILLAVDATNVTCATDLNGSAIASASNGAAPYQYTWTTAAGTFTGPTISNLGVGAYSVTTTDANGCTAANLANIVNTDQVQANYNLASVGCDPNLQTTLTDASNGATNWAWTIITNVGVQSFSGQNPGSIPFASGDNGTIQLTVTSVNGCASSISQPFSITGETLDISLSSTNLNDCENTPISITAVNNDPTNSVNFTWTSSTPGLTISNPNSATTSVSGAAGTYILTLTATSASGCTATLPANIVYDAGQSLSGDITANLCNGLEVSFNNASSTTGTWNFGDGITSTQADPTHTYAQAGQVMVTFTPNGACVAAFDTMITVLPTPAVQASFQHQIVTCDSVAVFNFVNTTTPTTGLIYSWVLGQNITSNDPNPTATYSNIGPITAILTATDMNGCMDTANVTFPFHIIDEDIAPSQSFCIGTTPVALNPVSNPDYDYKWYASPVDPSLDSMATNPIVQPNVPTTYTVVVTWGGCEVTKMVTISPNPAANLVAPTNINSCLVGDTILTATSSNGSIIWSTNPNFSNPTLGSTYTLTQPITNGNLYVQAETVAGCTNNATVAISIQPVDINFINTNPLPVCAGSVVSLIITNTDLADILTYTWSGGLPPISSPTLTPTSSGSYSATVTNQYGCTAVANFNLEYVQLDVSITNLGKDTICPGETTMLTASHPAGNYSYEWSPANFVESGAGTQTATVFVSSSEIFHVTITDDNGCTATNKTNVAFRNLLCARPYVFLPSAFTPNGDTENDRIMVRGINIEELDFVIFDRWGEKIYSTNTVGDLGWDGYFRGTESAPDSYGYYFRVKCTGGETYEEKGNLTLLK